MNLEELYKSKCKVLENVIIRDSSQLWYTAIEQECHFNIQRDRDLTLVCCSHQPLITKLAKNPLFEIDTITISRENKVLQVMGNLPGNAISIRKLINK